ncbi:outer membrane beta-barrel protein [Flavobacterium sp.]|uniref:outer membrane beta-barrel protein n=1 Tax=Flavobacterium sp. TaxID=239 RepID=UPI003752C5FE
MKKLILGLTVITALFAQNANAQESMTSTGSKGLYFKTNVGYNFAASNSQLSYYETPLAIAPTPFWNVTETSGDDRIEVVDVNLGKGLNFGATIGYMFNDRFGAELEVDYLMGSKTEAKQTELSGDYATQSLHSRMLQIKPTFVLSGGYATINPYAKFGAIIGSGKIIEEYNSVNGSDIYNAEVEAKGGIAFGFHAGLGMSFGLTPKLSLFGELNMNNLSYAPKDGKMTKYIHNGVDELATLDINEREYEYTENPTLSSSDPNQPLKAPKTSYNYNTLGINIGLKYSL